MCREGVMLQPQWDSTDSHQLRMQLYTPGHELKAVAARHIHPCFRERPWRLSWVVLKCTTANLLIQHTAKWGAGLGWGKRAHAGLVREDETSEYHTERYTSVEKWPAVALPEQMTARFHLTAWEHVSQRFHGIDAIYFRAKFGPV